MKRSLHLLFVTSMTTCLGIAAWHNYKEPKVEVQIKEEIRVVQPDDVEACVSLTKWQLNKMLSRFEENAHPSDSLKFKTIVKKDAGGWRLSSTHLAKGADEFPLPPGQFFVVDSSYVDHAGDFKSCVEYAHSYQNFHDYIVLSAE